MVSAVAKSDPAACPAWLWGSEVALIFILFFLFAGGEPPGINESHYLCKAKHYWNPTWCQHDFFLQSADAHASFYWTFGWLTKFFSLATTAWIGRVIVWLLQAWAWQRLSWALAPQRLMSLLSAGVFLALLRNCHMAGEWVVGDVEAKGLAYVLVFLGLEALVRQRWHWVFPLMGAAAAFHVIVGGWAVVAAGFTYVVFRWQRSPNETVPSGVAIAPSVVVGFLLSLPGLLPVLLLDRGTASEIVDQGNVIYVYVRLNHHLVISRMPWDYILRHLALLLALATIVWRLRGLTPVRLLAAFTVGAVVLEFAGVAIDQGLLYASDELRARLLRYYWYRLGDAIVPAALALLLVQLAATRAGVPACRAEEKPIDTHSHSWWLVPLLALATWNIVDVQWSRYVNGVPEGELRLRKDDAALSLRQRHHDWLACCDWIRSRTEPDAVFLTPRGQQTFLWYAHRAEVVNWKNCPQDAQGVVNWLRRYEDVFPQPGGERILFGPQVDPALPLENRLTQLGEKYDAEYVVLDRSAGPARLNLPRIYPSGEHFNLSFEVYRIGSRRRG